MVNPLKKLLGKGDKYYTTNLYMAEPAILYHSRTERKCKSYLKEYFKARKIHVPLDYRKKTRNFFELLMTEVDVIVGVIIEDVYTYPVWRDLEYADSLHKPYFTLRVVKTRGGRDMELFLLEKMVDFEKLSWEETQALYMEIQKKEAGVTLFLPRSPEY